MGLHSNPQKVVIVTGPAGAGRTTAIHALEDFGYEAIDNLPIALLDRLLSGPPLTQPLAIGIDPRTRGFSQSSLLEAISDSAKTHNTQVELLFVDCRVDVLLTRFSETRRKHPSARNETPKIGVDRELEQLAGLRQAADILIDTSELTPHELRNRLAEEFESDAGHGLAISVHSFAFKREAPRSMNTVWDLRFLKNPHWVPELRAMDGRDPGVGEYIKTDPLYLPFTEKLQEITSLLLPAYKAEGKSYFSIGFGCTGGKHRSVFVAETFANDLAKAGWQVSIRHRELERVGRVSGESRG